MKKLFVSFALIGIVVSFYMLQTASKSQYYDKLYVIPLLFSMILIVVYAIYKQDEGSITIEIMAFIGVVRYLITPLLLQLSGETSKITNMNAFNHADAAIMLQCYEMLVIWVICFCKLKFKHVIFHISFQRSFKKKGLSIGELKTKYLVEAGLVFLAFFMLCILKYPALLGSYHFIWKIIGGSRTSAGIRVPSIYYAISQFSLNGVRAIAIWVAMRLIDKQKVGDLSRLFWIVVILLLSVIIVSDDRAFSFFYGIVIILATTIKYPKLKKYMIIIGIAGLGVAFRFLLSVSSKSAFASSETIKLLSETFQSYFQGTTNISVALELTPYNWPRILKDVGKSITGVAYFFQKHEDIKVIYNHAYYFNSKRTGQIIPFIGQGYFYFGYVLSPLLTVLVLRNAFTAISSVRKEDNLEVIYLQCFKGFLATIALLMYNFNVYVSIYASLLIPLLIAVLYGMVRSFIVIKK